MGFTDQSKRAAKLRSALYVLIAVQLCPTVFAANKAASPVNNQASLDYAPGLQLTSNKTQVLIDELTDLNLILDGDDLRSVASPSSNIIRFQIIHLGNGQQPYALSVRNGERVDYELTDLQLFIDGNGNGSYEAESDLAYDPENLPVLGRAESLSVFVLAKVPADQPVLSVGQLLLSAQAADVGELAGQAGASIDGAGDGGTDLVIGNNGATQTASVTLEVNNNAGLQLEKSLVSIEDPNGGNEPVPGAELTYEISVSFSGEGELNNIEVADPIPENTNYINGSLQINGNSASDAEDEDLAHFDVLNQQVVLAVDRVVAPTQDISIQFQVRIR